LLPQGKVREKGYYPGVRSHVFSWNYLLKELKKARIEIPLENTPANVLIAKLMQLHQPTMDFSSSPFASPMKTGHQSPARGHQTPKKMTMSASKGAQRQKVMEACLRKVKANRSSLLSSMRAGSLTPATFRNEIGKLVNYEWSTMDNGAGVGSSNPTQPPETTPRGLSRESELEEAEFTETIIALEQAFLEDLRREGTPKPL
jgi:hypothetical protein